MTWVKLDDNLPLNPKVRRVSVAARWSYVASICYAGNSRTDGYVPCGALALVDGTPRIAEELVAAGLWETAPDGWRIHDYLKHNRSKEKVEQVSTVRSEAGRVSAAKRQQSVEHNANKVLNKKAAVSEQDVQHPVLSASASVSEEEEVQEEEKQLARLIRGWENATGTTVTRSVGDHLAEWLELLPEAAIVKAIAETGASNARNWRYCEAILKRYQVEGWADKPKAEPYREPPPQERIPMAEEVFEQIRNRPAVPVPDELEYLRANDPEAYERELAHRERSRAKLAAHMAAKEQAT